MPTPSSSPTARRRSNRPTKKVIREFNDRGLLWLLEDLANLHDLLRVVEPELADRLDFSRAAFLPRTFIPADLRKRETDLLVSVPFRDAAAGEVWLFFLLEHQSRRDPWMALRLFLYMARIRERQLRLWDDQQVPDEQRVLSPIVPLILYTGSEQWEAPIELATLMRLPAEVARFVPTWETLRLNLRETSPEALTGMATAVGWALRALQAADEPLAEMERVLAEAMAGLGELTKEQAGQWERAAWFVVMLTLYRREEPELAEKLVEQARSSKFGVGRKVARMGRTIAEQIEDKGEAKGLRRALITVLTRRYGPPSAEIAAALEQADVTTMNTWLDTAATAATLDEVGILPT